MALGARIGQAISPALTWPQISRGLGGKSNVLDAVSPREYDNFYPREGEASGDASGLQKRYRRNSAPVDSPLLERIQLVFLAFTDLDGFITFRLD
jgi:hypothetical protein